MEDYQKNIRTKPKTGIYISREGELMDVKEFCKTHEKFVTAQVKRITKTKRILSDDLHQEGMLSLVELFESGRIVEAEERNWNGYVNVVIKRALLKYIAHMSGTVTVSHNKFFQKNFIVPRYEGADTQLDNKLPNTEKRMVKAEDQMLAYAAIVPVLMDLKPNEMFVWDNIITAEKPWTTGQAAHALGYKSKSSITYIKNKIIKRIREGIENVKPC